MSDLYVDVNGMTYLYNQVNRVFHDSYAASKHIYQYAHLEWHEVGLIFGLAGTHRRARDLIGGAVDFTAVEMEALRTAIYLCQQKFVHAEANALEQFDARFPPGPAAEDIVAAVDDIRPHLPDVLAPGAFADAAFEPSRYLQPPPAVEFAPYQMDFLYDLLSPSSWIRQISLWVLDTDPFEPWLQALTGDWEGWARCGVVWQQIGQCAEDLASNLLCAVRDIPFVWRGNAGTALQVTLVDHAWILDHLGDASRFYADRYREASAAAYDCFDALSSLVSDLIDTLVYAEIAAAIGTATFPTVVGPASGYSVAAFYISSAIEIYFDISARIDGLKTAIAAINAATAAYQATQTWHLKEPARFALPPT